MLSSNGIRLVGLAGVLAVGGAVACSDSGPELAPSQARISIADGIAARTAVPFFSASVNGVLVAVSPDTVESLEITFIEVAYLPVGGDDNVEDAWQTVTLGDSVTLDLMSLPTESEGSVGIASGSVPVGSYRKVRLLVGEGEIVFKGPLSLGGAASFDGGTPYAVTIPSGDQTGLKTDVPFEVSSAEDGTVNAAYLVFEPGTTFQNITVTGNGGVMLAPVLRAK
ncbi:MAG: DUF4382 domain-containing protein [Gemmatimonadota bacterium]|nr:DUF4382 domain-containing protein [Gemmatimonadota bacterium]MDH4350140.1 DUF4382 domain-containing protein [Gemmatimonadota bacterium]MDH5196564.1 DUF4382 domain-containing protein [Gemmatimonadota bacterium]